MATLANLIVNISADTRSFQAGLRQTEALAAAISRGVSSTMGTMGVRSATAFGAMEDSAKGFGKAASGLLLPTSVLADKLGSVEPAAEKAGRGMRNAGNEAKGLLGRLEKVGTQMGLMFGGAALTAAITVPFVAFAKAAFTASVGFETAFAGVRKTVDATEVEFAQLERNFRGLAKQVPVTAEEFARIGELAGQLGVRGVDNITKFSEVISKLAVTTNLTADEGAMAFARFANIMQMPIANVDRLGAVVVDLGNNLATTEQEITAFALRIAASGRQVGLTEAQVMAFGAALSSVGIEAEAGGTAISRVFAKLATVVAMGGEDLKEFASVAGTSAEQFAAAFRDNAALATVQFIEGLRGVSESGGNVFGVLEKLELQDIRVRNALLSTANAGDLLRRSLKMADDAWKSNTALNIEAAKRFETIASKIQVMKNNFAELARTIGDRARPAINSMVESAANLAKSLQDMPGWVVSAGLALGGLLATVGPLLLGLSAMGAVISGLRAAATAFGITLTTLLARAGLVGLVLAAIGALVLLVTHWDEVTAAVKRYGLAAADALRQGAAIAGIGGMRVQAAQVADYYHQQTIALRQAERERARLEEQGAFIRYGQADIADQMAIDQIVRDAAQREKDAAAAAQAAGEAARKSAEALTSAAKALTMALRAQDQVLSSLDAEWAIYQAGVGKAAESAEGLARQKEYLSGRLALVRDQVQFLRSAYGAAVVKSGEYAEETLDLAGKLNKARVTEAELGAQIREVNIAMIEFSAPVLAAKKNVKSLTATVDSLTRAKAAFSAQLDVAKTKLSATNDAVSALEKTMDISRGAIKSALGDMGSHVDFLKTKISDMRAGLKAALSDMAAHVSDLAGRLGDAKSALQALTSVRLTGQGAFEEQIAAFEQQERQLRLTMNALRTMGERAPKTEVEAVQRQLEQLGLMRERITLEREIDVVPLQRELTKLTNTAQEVSFAEAKEAIEKQQAEVARLSDEYVRAKRTLEELTAATADVVDELRHFSFADAQIAALAAAAAIRATLPEYAAAKNKLIEMQAAVAGVMEEARKLNFSEAVAAIDRLKAALEGNAKDLLALQKLQADQKTALANVKLALDLHTLALGAQKTALEQASSALDALREAARAAAAAMSVISGVAQQVQPVPVPLPPAVGTVAGAATISGAVGAGAQLPALAPTISGIPAAIPLPPAALEEFFGIGRGAGGGRVLNYAGGGTVPGPLGAPMPAIVHGGERVLTPGQQGSVSIQVRVEGPVYGLLDFDDRVRQAVRDGMRGGAFRGVIAKP